MFCRSMGSNSSLPFSALLNCGPDQALETLLPKARKECVRQSSRMKLVLAELSLYFLMAIELDPSRQNILLQITRSQAADVVGGLAPAEIACVRLG